MKPYRLKSVGDFTYEIYDRASGLRVGAIQRLRYGSESTNIWTTAPDDGKSWTTRADAADRIHSQWLSQS